MVLVRSSSQRNGNYYMREQNHIGFVLKTSLLPSVSLNKVQYIQLWNCEPFTNAINTINEFRVIRKLTESFKWLNEEYIPLSLLSFNP